MRDRRAGLWQQQLDLTHLQIQVSSHDSCILSESQTFYLKLAVSQITHMTGTCSAQITESVFFGSSVKVEKMERKHFYSLVKCWYWSQFVILIYNFEI